MLTRDSGVGLSDKTPKRKISIFDKHYKHLAS